MHTEHLRNVHPGWVVSGWLVAIAVSSLILLVLAGAGLDATPDGAVELVWTAIAVAAGFFVGGFSIGYRAAVDAPVLHGIGIGLTTLIAWLPLNVLVDLVFNIGESSALTPGQTVAFLLVQMLTAVGGTWTGHNLALAGDTDLTD